MTAQDKITCLEEISEDMVIFPDIADALIGYGEQFGTGIQAVYDTEKVIDIYMKQGMSREEAQEYFYFNTLGLGLAGGTPIFVTRFEEL